MEWDNSIFDEAFDSVGMREGALLLDTEPPTPFMVRFERPQVILEDETVHSTDYEIEYTTTDAPSLTFHSMVEIGGVQYRVRQEPTTVGDGFWSRAMLEMLS